jgi:HSP20 family protein
MSVVRWRPFDDMLTLREAMDRLFEDSVVRPARRARRAELAQLPVNVWEDEDSLHVVARVPGLQADDIDITISGDVLTIRGRFPSDAERDEAKDWSWHLNELWYGPFERTIALTTKVQPDKAEAVFTNGVLHLSIARAEEVKPKAIKVKVA